MEKTTRPPIENESSIVEEGSSSQTPPNIVTESQLPRWRLICLTICISFGLFLSLLDTTIVATALYTIGLDLNSLSNINWVALSYTLSYLSCAVLFARISDIIGRRNAYISAFLIFFAFSLGCGFAKTLQQLIVCRVLQGIGGAGLYSLTFVILPEISPPKLAQATGALAGAVVAMAGVLGPVLGGVITHYTTWRWIFWINAPIGIFPLLLFIFAWPKPHQIQHAERRPWKELDILGAALVIAASVLLVFSFQQAGIKASSWSTALFLAPLLIGILCWFALLGWEILADRLWPDTLATMFPLRLLRRRVFMGHFLTTLLAGFPYFMVIYALPLRIQVVNGKSQLVSGIALLPMLGSVAIASTIAGALNTKKDFICYTLITGALFMTIGTASLSTLDNTPSLQAKMYGFQVFVGLGFGLMVSTVSLGASMECTLRDRTVAQGIIAQARVLGGSIGIAASTVILSNTTHKELSFLSPQQLEHLDATATGLATEQRDRIRQAYVDAFGQSMRVCAVLSGVCVFAALVTWRKEGMVLENRLEEQRAEDEKWRVEKVRRRVGG